MGTLADLRARVADALVDLDPDWSVSSAPVDAVTPPAFVLVWADPWATRSSSCHYGTRLDVVAIAARINPEPGIETLETMVERAVPALDAARAPVVEIVAPGPFDIGGVAYLAARLTITSPVTLSGGN